MRKILSLILAVIICFGCVVPAYAAGYEWDQIVFELDSLRIIDKNTDMTLPVTRGEFAQMISRLMGMASLLNSDAIAHPFADVAADAPYASSVALLNRMGIMNGTSAAIFDPSAPITVEQAVKVMVVCTGYNTLALEKGGWSAGYMAVGAANGLLEDVDTTASDTRAQIYKVLYNALDVKILNPVYGTGEYVISGDTIRSNYLGINNSDLYSLTGVVNANSFGYVASPVPGLGKDEVVIDSVIYKIGNTAAFDLLGHKVSFFAYKEGNDYILHSIRPFYDEKVIQIAADDVAGKTGGELKYFQDNREYKARIATSPERLVYNGIRVQYPTDSMYQGTIGTLTLIDHQGDGTYDVTMIDRYESYVAKSYKEGLFMFNENTLYRGSNSLYIDPYDDARQFIVTDMAGDKIEDFTGDRVVSIFADAAGSRYRFVVSDLKISGILTEISDDTWTIGSDGYALDRSAALSGDVGTNYDVYLNFNKEISFINEKTTDNYGYILASSSGDSFTRPQVRLLEAGAADFGVSGTVDDVDAVQTPYLFAANKAISTYAFADRAIIDGHSYKSVALTSVIAALEGATVRFILNPEGEIQEIATLVNYGGSTTPGLTLKYNIYDMTFGGRAENLVTPFAINKDTKVICVPNGDFSDADALSSVKIDAASGNAVYTVLGFERDDITKRAGLMVMFANMNSQDIGNITINTSRSAIVSNISQRIDEATGDVKLVAELLTDSEYITYEALDNDATYASLRGITAGDVVNYSVNLAGKLEGVMKIASMAAMTPIHDTNRTAGYEYCFGSVASVYTDEIKADDNIMATVLNMTVNGAPYIYHIPQRNKPPVYIYNKVTKKVSPGALGDIIPGGDKVYLAKISGKSTIKAVVIVR